MSRWGFSRFTTSTRAGIAVFCRRPTVDSTELRSRYIRGSRAGMEPGVQEIQEIEGANNEQHRLFKDADEM
jgi:hypothetical protein